MKHTHTMYGFFPGGDPRKFHPDGETTTVKEMENYKEACAAWDAFDKDGTVKPGLERGPDCTHAPGVIMTRCQFGLGVSVIDCDEECEDGDYDQGGAP